jgi:hypothetical protein
MPDKSGMTTHMPLGAAGAALLFLCALMLGFAPHASATASGFFSSTGSMTVAREAPAAAPLADGRVLVAGGNTADRTLSSTEIFDPPTGTFSPSGSMSTPRADAAAAPLPGGRVLVAGGFKFGVGELSSAEVFDPGNGTFAPTGSMSVRRAAAGAAPLPDGRVLVAGGSSDDGPLSSAEIFDPATGTFSPTGSMSAAEPGLEGRGLSDPAAASLPDGRVLIAGGFVTDHVSVAVSSALVFDPTTERFSSAGIGSMSLPRGAAAAAPLPNGALIAGGASNDGALSSAEVFGPGAGTFSPTGSMSHPRYSAAAAPLPGGRALVAGGCCAPPLGPLSSAEIFTSSFSFRKLKHNKKKGIAFLAVDVPGPGLIGIKGQGTAKFGLSSKSAATDGGRKWLRVKPAKKGREARKLRKLLLRKGKAKTKIWVTYLPDGGTANTNTRKVKLLLKRRR